MSFIKIQTPSNQIFNIDLGTTETDLINLLSCLSNIEQDKIKGLKDKFGNYYTLYAALFNPQGNFNYSNIYFLVCSNDNPNQNLNYPILDKFENFPDKEIPNSFTHDNNNYFKRKNLHSSNNNLNGHLHNVSVHNNNHIKNHINTQNQHHVKFANPNSQICFREEINVSPSPIPNRTFMSNINSSKSPINHTNKIHLRNTPSAFNNGTMNSNPFHNRNYSNNFSNRTLLENSYFDNFDRFTNLNNQINNDNNNIRYNNFDRIENEDYSLNYTNNRINAMDHLNHENDSHFVDNLSNIRNIHNKNNIPMFEYQELNKINNNKIKSQNKIIDNTFNYDDLRRNLIPNRNVDPFYNHHLNKNNISNYESFIGNNKFNPSFNISGLTNVSNSTRFEDNSEFNKRNNLIPNSNIITYNNHYENSNNLKILKEKKLYNEKFKLLKDNIIIPNNNNISRDLKQMQIEKYFSIVNDLTELNLIDDKFLPKLKQLILNENEDITTILKLFCQDVIEIETLISGINKILGWTTDKNRRPDSPQLLNKNQLIKLIDSLNDSIFDDPADHILLRNLANYENDFILAAYELYLSDHDIENFIDSVKRFINKYNRPNNNLITNNTSRDFFKGNIINNNFPNSYSILNNKSNPSRNLASLSSLKNNKKDEIFNHKQKQINSDEFNHNQLNKIFNTKEFESDQATKEENIDLTNKFQNFKLEYVHDNNIENTSSNKNPNKIENKNLSNLIIPPNNVPIQTSMPSSNQSKAVSNLNLNANSSEIKTNYNNQFSSFHNQKDQGTSVFTSSNNTMLYNKHIINSNNNNSENVNDKNQNNFIKEENNQNSDSNNVNNNNIENNNANNNVNNSISSFENLLKFLHTEQRIIFKYAIKNKLPEINIFAQLHSTIDSEDILLRTVKQFCKQFISEKITKNFDDNINHSFKNLIQKRDQNLLGYFKEFNKHNSIEKLQLDILQYLKENNNPKNNQNNVDRDVSSKSNNNYIKEKEREKDKTNKNNNNDKKLERENDLRKNNEKESRNTKKEKHNKSFPSSDSEENIEEDSRYNRKESANNNYRNSNKFEESENENNYDSNNNYNASSSSNLNRNYNLSEFLKLINNFNFLNPNEKQLIENLINEKNSEAIEILESYHKNKNILAIKSSIKSLIKKYLKLYVNNKQKNNYLDKDENRNSISNKDNKSNNQINYNKKGGEILSKLEKIKKQSKETNESKRMSNDVYFNNNQNDDEYDYENTNKKINKKDKNQNYYNQYYQPNSNAGKKVPSIPLNKLNNNQNQIYNSNNENYYDESVHVIANEDEDNSNDSDNSFDNDSQKQETNNYYKSNNDNYTKKNSYNIENKSYESLDELLQDLEEGQKISSHQHKYIIQRYKNKDEILLSAWEVYTFNKYLPDLIESLRIFSTNVRRQSYVATMGKTPVALAKSKNDIIDFLKSKDNNREKEEIKKKQLNIIEILVKENMLDKKTAPIINQMIFEENHFLISAFEIFSVSKDHWEFVETLGMITDIYCNDVKKMSKSSTSLDKVSPLESKDSRLAILFENFIKNNNKIFSEKEIDIFRKKLFTKDDFFMSALEFYENNLDQDEFVENLQQVLK